MLKRKISLIIILSVIISLASILGTTFVLQSTGAIVSEKIALEVKVVDELDIIYDGESHTAKKIEYDNEVLQNGHTVELVKFSDSITDVGSIRVTPEVVVKDNNNNIVTNDYKITYVEGTISVIPRPIEVKPKDISAIYTANIIKSSDFEIISGSLVPGHIISPSFISGVVDAGKYQSKLTTKILDLRGNDVSKNYSITNSTGEIIVNKNTFNIVIDSISKEFDNKGISSKDITYSVSASNPLDNKNLLAELTFNEEELSLMKDVDIYKLSYEKCNFYIDGQLINNNNYSVTLTEGEVEIIPYTITNNDISIEEEIYSGDEIIPSVNCNLFGEDGILSINDKYKDANTYKIATENFILNNSNYVLSEDILVEFVIHKRIIDLKINDALPEGYVLDGSLLTKTYDKNIVDIDDLVKTVNDEEAKFLTDNDIYIVDVNGDKFEIVNAGEYDIILASTNSNIGFILDGYSIKVNSKKIECSFVDGINEFTKTYDGKIFDIIKHLEFSNPEEASYVSVDGLDDYINASDSEYKDLEIKSNNDNYYFENMKYNIKIEKLKLQFNLQESYFAGDDIYYNFIKQLKISDDFRLVINDDLLTNDLENKLKLTIEEICGNNSDKSKSISKADIDKLIERKVISIYNDNNEMLDLLNNTEYVDSEGETTDEYKIINYNQYSYSLIIKPEMYTATYYDTLLIPENSLKFSYYLKDNEGNILYLPSYLSVNVLHEDYDYAIIDLFEIDENNLLQLNPFYSVQIIFTKDGNTYDMTQCLYSVDNDSLQPLMVKVNPVNISITTPSASKKIGGDWNVNPFDFDNLSIPPKYQDGFAYYDFMFENQNVSEVGTYSNTVVLNNEDLQKVYNITFIYGTLTIYAKETQIIASKGVVEYGTGFSLTDYVRWSGDELKDNVSSFLLLKDEAGNDVTNDDYSQLEVGKYTLTADVDMLDTVEGYNIKFYSADIDIVPLEVYVSINDQEFQIGEDSQEYYDDFVNSYNIPLDSKLGYVTTTDDSLLQDAIDELNFEINIDFVDFNTKTYDINLSHTDNPNYNVNLIRRGQVKFNKCNITIKVLNQTKVYDGEDCLDDLNIQLNSTTYKIETNSYGHNHFLNDTNFENAYTIEFKNGFGSDCDDYPITINFDNILDQYDVQIEDGVFSITKGTLTLEAPNFTKYYDGKEVEISDITELSTISYSAGFIPDFVNTMPIELDILGSYSNVGTYPNAIGFTGVVKDFNNYDVVINEGEIIIHKGTLTLEAPSFTKYYDGKEVEISDITELSTISYSAGFIPDFVNTMPIELDILGSYSNVGTYPNAISFTGVVEDVDNYEVRINKGSITINKIKLSFSALDFTVENNGETISKRIEARTIPCKYDVSSSTPLSLELLNYIKSNLEFSMIVEDNSNDGTVSGSSLSYLLAINCMGNTNFEIESVDLLGTITIE